MTTSSAFAAGDVVQVEFPFADTESGKDRPALVIAGPSMHGDYTVSMISKQAQDDGVPIGASDFASGSLKAASFVRVRRLYTLGGDNILTLRGRLKPAAVDRVLAKLCPTLGCKC
jgi:PemK-like, MazF-like toxin of type II toxin-antitoxin system